MDYKKYSLENLENWLHDAMSAGEATPQEIYDVIVGVVKENYECYKKQADQADKLLSLLNGFGKSQYDTSFIDISDILREREYYEQSNMTEQELSQYKVSLSCDKNDPSPECKGAWNDFWESGNYTEYNLREAEYYNKNFFVSEDGDIYPSEKDKVVKWQLPVNVDGLTGDCFVQFPDDLLERAGLKEGDVVSWIDRGDGSFELRKVNGTK